jgi:hypothetical protein
MTDAKAACPMNCGDVGGVLSFSALVFPECVPDDGGAAHLWAIQCLNFDFAAQGVTIEEAMKNFEYMLCAQMVVGAEQGRRPFESVPTAPREYWDRFSSAIPLGVRLQGPTPRIVFDKFQLRSVRSDDIRLAN